MEEAAAIPVTKVQLHPIDDSGPTRAIGSVTIGNAFVVHGVRVVDSQNGLFVAMPQRKDGDRYRDVAHPVTGPMRALLSAAVLEEFERMRVRDRSDRGRNPR